VWVVVVEKGAHQPPKPSGGNKHGVQGYRGIAVNFSAVLSLAGWQAGVARALAPLVQTLSSGKNAVLPRVSVLSQCHLNI